MGVSRAEATPPDVVELTGQKGKTWFDRFSVDKTLVLHARPGAFRFHGIIREYLLGELAVSHKKRLPNLLHRAGNCYQKRGDVIAAFRSFTQAGRDGDLTRALGLFLLPEAVRIPSRHIHEIHAAVQSIPTRIRAKQPLGYLAYLRLLIAAGGEASEMKWLLSEAESFISSIKAIPSAMRRRLHGEVAIIKGILAFNDMSALWQWYDHARASLQGQSQIHPQHVAWHFGCPHLSHLCLPGGGKYKKMIRDATITDETATVLSGEPILYGDVLRLEYSVERGDVQRAWKCLERFADKNIGGTMSEVHVCFSHARLLLLEGRVEEAVGTMREIHLRMTESGRMNLALCSELGLDYIHSCLGQNELVSGWIRDGDFLSQSTGLEQKTAFLFTVYGKTLLTAGEYERLLAVSRNMQSRFGIHDKLLCRIHARILEAICFLNLEGLTPAVHSLRIAFELARPDGLVLAFSEYGRHITTLLRRVMKKTETQHCQRILALSECFQNHAAGVSKGGKGALSLREREIMHLIAKGMSNRAVGHDLGITEKTVRDVLSRVYSQLGVSNRTRAAYLYELHYERKDASPGAHYPTIPPEWTYTEATLTFGKS